jgi:hypothetical protein
MPPRRLPPKPTISWLSVQRFDRCPRAWLHHYALDAMPKDLRPALAVEGQLMPWGTLTGQVVDDVVSQSLGHYARTGEWQDPSMRVHPRALEYVRYSRNWRQAVREGREVEQDDGLQPLEPYFYDENGPSREEHRRMLADARKCVRNFELSDLPERFRRAGVDNWRLPAKATGQITAWYRLGDVPVWASYDFMLHEGQDLYIFDWKTGNLDPRSEERTRRQLHAYALYAREALGVLPERIRLVPVWLSVGSQSFPEPVDPALLEELECAWRDRHRLLKDLLQGSASTRRERFPMTEDLRQCARCVFRSCEGFGRAGT